jgi:hypothetical protein
MTPGGSTSRWEGHSQHNVRGGVRIGHGSTTGDHGRRRRGSGGWHRRRRNSGLRFCTGARTVAARRSWSFGRQTNNSPDLGQGSEMFLGAHCFVLSRRRNGRTLSLTFVITESLGTRCGRMSSADAPEAGVIQFNTKFAWLCKMPHRLLNCLCFNQNACFETKVGRCKRGSSATLVTRNSGIVTFWEV